MATLHAWLKERAMTPTDFARALDVDPATITRLLASPSLKQRRRPGPRLVRKIHAATGGAVTANDWMDNAPAADDPSAARDTDLAHEGAATCASR